MVPDVAKTGHSFTGAFAYYLHDKRETGERRRSTTERVAWTETRNLDTHDPDTARRVMISTARRADELKAAAGVKATGRKSTAHVYAYALSWHPSEAAQLDRAEMIRAADASLKVLGADRHQALIVCHRDRGHPHVHVIVNRVDPRNGKMLPTSNDFRKLSAWAHEYEKERGAILTPARAKRAEEADCRRRAHPDPEQRRALVRERSKETRAVRKAHQEGVMARDRAGERIDDASDLRILAADQRASHREAWVVIANRHKESRAAIVASTDAAISAVMATHKAETKPIWARHFHEERKRWQEFERLQKTPWGVLALSVSAARERIARDDTAGHGLLVLTFAHLLSPMLRYASLKAAQERDRLALANRLRSRLEARLAPLKAERDRTLKQHDQGAARERAELKQNQEGERSKLRESWRRIYAIAGKDPRYLARQACAFQSQERPKTSEPAGPKQPGPAMEWAKATSSSSQANASASKAERAMFERIRQARSRSLSRDQGLGQ